MPEAKLYPREVEPSYPDTYARLHLDQYQNIPEPKLFDEFQQLFSEKERERFAGLRQEAIKLMLLEIRDKISFSLRNTREHISNEQCKVFSDFSSFLHTVRQSEEPQFAYKVAVALAAINETNLITFTKTVFANHPDYKVDKIAEIKGWGQEGDNRAYRYVAKIALRLLNSSELSQQPGQYAECSLLYTIISAIIAELLRISSSISHYAQRALIESAVGEIDSTKAGRAQSETASGRDDEEEKKLRHLEELNPTERTALVLQEVRQATDLVRKTIPAMIAGEMSAQHCFWRINQIHFQGDPLLAQMLAGSKGKVMDYIKHKGSRSFYEQQVGRARLVEVSSGSSLGKFDHLESRYLSALEVEFFSRLDQFESFETETDFFQFLAIVDLFMFATHLPFDGSGRTIEDFEAYLGHKYGYPVTITLTGYREATSMLMHKRERVTQHLKGDLDLAVLDDLAINYDPDLVQAWGQNYIIELIEKQRGLSREEARRVFESARTLLIKRAIAALDTDNISSSYQNLRMIFPSLDQTVDLWQTASVMEYNYLPDKISERCDQIVALVSTQNQALYNTEKGKALLDEVDQMAQQYPNNKAVLGVKRYVYSFLTTDFRIRAELAAQICPEHYPAQKKYLDLLSLSQDGIEFVREKYEQALALNENDWELHAMMARKFLRPGETQDCEEAERYLQLAIETDPNNHQAYLEMANLQREHKGDWAQALSYHRKSLELRALGSKIDFKELFQLAVTYQELGQSHQAIKEMEAAVLQLSEKSLNFQGFYLNYFLELAKLYLQTDLYAEEKAKKTLRLALKVMFESDEFIPVDAVYQEIETLAKVLDIWPEDRF